MPCRQRGGVMMILMRRRSSGGGRIPIWPGGLRFIFHADPTGRLHAQSICYLVSVILVSMAYISPALERIQQTVFIRLPLLTSKSPAFHYALFASSRCHFLLLKYPGNVHWFRLSHHWGPCRGKANRKDGNHQWN